MTLDKEYSDDDLIEALKILNEYQSDDLFSLMKSVNLDPLKELRGQDLRECDLSNFDFSGADLRDTNFENAKLTNTIFQNAKLDNANFKSADLDGTIFTGASLDNANFEKAVIPDNQLSKSEFTRVTALATKDVRKDFIPNSLKLRRDEIGLTLFDLLSSILGRPAILSIVNFFILAIFVTPWIIAHFNAEPGKEVSIWFGAIKYVKKDKPTEVPSDLKQPEEQLKPPSHKFQIPVHEKIVTNNEYINFTKSFSLPKWNEENNNPVVDITWNDARAYCEWKGTGLLTEKEWLSEVNKPIPDLYEWTATDAPNNQAVVCSSLDLGKNNCSSVKSKDNSGTNITFRCR